MQMDRMYHQCFFFFSVLDGNYVTAPLFSGKLLPSVPWKRGENLPFLDDGIDLEIDFVAHLKFLKKTA